MAQIAHHVFFTLHDQSNEATSGLIAACHKYLDGHPGVVYFAAGSRCGDLVRDVNDLQFDVSLHVVFADRHSHDIYQEADRHKQFIAEQRENWAEVRVFDSVLG
jgi:hypothetical protein